MKKLKKLKLEKKSVALLSKEQLKTLKGGSETIAWNTHVNTCFTRNCC